MCSKADHNPSIPVRELLREALDHLFDAHMRGSGASGNREERAAVAA